MCIGYGILNNTVKLWYRVQYDITVYGAEYPVSSLNSASCLQKEAVLSSAIGSGLRAQGSGLRAQGSGLTSQGSGLRAHSLGVGALGFGLRAQGSGLTQPSGLRAQGSGRQAVGHADWRSSAIQTAT